MYFGPNLAEKYKNYLKRVLINGGFYSRPDAKDFQNDTNNILTLNPILYTSANAGSASLIYSPIPEDGSGDFTFSRTGSATYFDKDGILKTAAANLPRFEFEPLTDEYKGILIEPIRTNLLTQSEGFTTTAWTKTAVTVTGSAAIAPNGTLTAQKVVANSQNTSHWIIRGISFSDLDIFTFSIFAKRAEYDFFNIGDLQFGAFRDIRFDLVNGIISPITSANTYISATIKDVGDGWYRCSVTHTNYPPTSTAYTFAGIPTLNSGLAYQGDGVSGVFIWGAQLERGTIATSYIPTVASQVTRPADVISISNKSNLFGQSGGSIFFEFKNAIPSSLNMSGLLLATSNGNSKVVFTYSTTEKKLYKDGILIDSSTGSFSYGTLDTLFLGSNLSGSGQFQNMNIKHYSTYNYVLSEEDSIKLTL
jgi:hypothetical protein